MHRSVNFNGFQLSVPNSTVNGDGFYISYNDHDVDIYGCDTTALVIGQMEKFFILNGDHRSAYANLMGQGLDACLAYFDANPEAKNQFSESNLTRHLGIDVPTAAKCTLMSRLAGLKTTISVSDGGVYHSDKTCCQVHLETTWTEEELDAWLYRSTGIDYIGTFVMKRDLTHDRTNLRLHKAEGKMAKIHAVLVKLPSESVDEFKARCSQVQFSVAEGHASIATAPIGPIGRFTLTDRGLECPMSWGVAHKDILPSETCVIASYFVTNGRLDAHPFSQVELDAAPRNPELAAETDLPCELDPHPETAEIDRPSMRESHG